MTDAILQQREHGLLILQLNRPDKKNALTRAMYTQLAEALKRADADPAISAVVIQGSTECFTAGNDIGDFLEQPPSDLDSPPFHFMNSLLNCRKPVIAAVHGHAVGAGHELALAADIRIVTQDARVGLPFIHLALSGGCYLLPRTVGLTRAVEMLFTGRFLTGAEALAERWAHELVEDQAGLDAAVERWTQHFTTVPTKTIAYMKQQIYRAHESSL
ncbi:MAG: enoyl-CoA hydratase/isomerase family protein, partial [Pseudomonas sp.]|uniref:enoyl-CoA hydratase/isomerase family protein n=1 Tax=Pseudomonas sp. TaxID=306 RepID=UPI00391BBEE6